MDIQDNEFVLIILTRVCNLNMTVVGSILSNYTIANHTISKLEINFNLQHLLLLNLNHHTLMGGNRKSMSLPIKCLAEVPSSLAKISFKS